MERPPSQSENVRPSGLKPPSKLPGIPSMANSTGRALQESSQSDINAKTAIGMPPPSGTLKHKLPGCSCRASDVVACKLTANALEQCQNPKQSVRRLLSALANR